MDDLNLSGKTAKSTSTLREVSEGRARLVLPAPALERPGVFYNPRMDLNRDIAILFVSSFFTSSRQVRICDAMTASGIRAVRYALESQNVCNVVAADREIETVEAARATVRLNQCTDRISVFDSDANVMLLSHINQRFDLIDLDPFGSPAPFFECSLRATADGGVVAATATDMAPLTGARAQACIRKYGVRPVRTEFEKEMAVRTLASCLVTIAGRLELGVEIVFSHATDHYARIYAAVKKGKLAANFSAKFLGFVEFCPTCLRRDQRPTLTSIRLKCEDCGSETRLGGPVWLGPIWDPRLVQVMIQRAPLLHSRRLSEIQNMLAWINDELTAPFLYFRTDAFARSLRQRPPALRQVLDELHGSGWQATRTHFHPNGFRTDAPCKDVATVFRMLA